MDGDQPFGGHSQPGRAHVQKVVADRVGDADDAIDPGIEVAPPGDRAQKADVADDAAIRNDPYRQSAGRPQAVFQRPVAEQVKNVVAAPLQLRAQPAGTRGGSPAVDGNIQ